MLSLATDENFNNNIIRGLLIRKPDIDIIRIQDVGLSGKDDPIILDWAAMNNRILMTHDVESMPEFAYERIKAGHVLPGIFIVNQHIPVGRVIDDLLILIECNEKEDWINQVFFLPL